MENLNPKFRGATHGEVEEEFAFRVVGDSIV